MEFKKPNRYDKERRQHNRPPLDDIRPAAPRSVQAVPIPPLAAPPESPQVTTKTSGITIRFGALPSKTAIMSSFRRGLFTKKALVVSIITIVVAGALVTGLLIHQHDIAKKSDARASTEAVEDLEYQTILPSGKSISALGGWKRVSPEKSEPVYAYTDKIGDISINVSEQPLPESFIGNTDSQVAELAEKFNATTKIDAGDVKAYVGTSAKGPQSAIFTKNSLLILIKSQEKIDDAAWAKYIKSLT